VRAVFEPTDLARLTTDLASAFRSAIERAGLQLIVSCPPTSAPVYVDREMWEKIVLNLLSNAFKFTFEGSIGVELGRSGEGHVELRVRDTGTGIAAEDLPHVFDRFHRIEGTRSRTQEGSGIGLALVRELVALHGGAIGVSSVPGAGTVFTVRLPLGASHLPAEHVRQADAAVRPDAPSTAAAATPYVQEALRWLPDTPPASERVPQARAAAPGARILVADDNADMRDYLARLLSGRFHVEAVRDGGAALVAARRQRPDLIVSDVMMPVLDGFQLVAALRDDEDTRAIPVILLSARAGEEARIDGLQSGADDYLVKPFSARELVARIEAQLVRAKLQSLEQEHALRLASVFAQAPVGVAILNGPTHVFEFANREYVALVGGRSVVGKPVREALPELEGQGIYELLDSVYGSGEPFVGRSVRAIIQRHGGEAEETFFDFVYQPLLDEQHRVTGIAVVVFDVTELTRARRAAEAANRAKDEFLAMLGHELRNPLAPILTALQLMRIRNVSGADRERTIIERQVSHMVQLIDDLLDVSRITRGKVQLRRARVDLADAVTKAIEMTSPAIDERRHVLHVEVPRGVLIVEGDDARLAQVLANLLTNAAKYTDAGGRIDITGESKEGSAVLRVADTGRGIAPDMLGRVFDLFSQERQEIDRSQGGLGLGLAIVRSLVQAHGGSVDVQSAGKGRGAEFTIRLPLSTVEAPQLESDGPAAPAALQDAAGRRILVVDDNADAAYVLADSLEALGYTTEMAFDGPSALEAAREFRPDAVLLDLGLPVMDGFEVARGLKADHGPGLEVVAVTGYGQEVDRQRALDAGFDEHMVKPVDIDRLDAWLRTTRRRVEPQA
jgi:signal transduction histidine kinase/DNA-binding response OmpR family regulator